MVKASPIRTVGRYAIYGEIAFGGMATVHIGRLLGPSGFSRTVAIKRLHPQYAKDPQFVSMFLDEARLAARIRHANVVPTLDVVSADDELFLVMEYVPGVSLLHLLKGAAGSGHRPPLPICLGVATGVLKGLHAAHEATDERGAPLSIVHRDVSPANVLVGIDGIARLLDFGVAKAVGRMQTTNDGSIKGKLPYMAPEQLNGEVTRRSDIYSASVVLWEMSTVRRLFTGENQGELISRVLSKPVEPPSTFAPGIPPEIDDIIMRGLDRDPSRRFTTAGEMAVALERAAGPGGVASMTEIGAWVESAAATDLAKRARIVGSVEASPLSDVATGTLGVPSPSQDVESPPLDEPATIPSARPEMPQPRSRSPRALVALLAISLIPLSIGILVLRRSPAPPPSAAASPGDTVVVDTSTEPHEVSAQSAPLGDPAAPAVSATSPVSRGRKKGILRSAGPSASASSPACDPPFNFVDGVKTYKPECFPR